MTGNEVVRICYRRRMPQLFAVINHNALLIPFSFHLSFQSRTFKVLIHFLMKKLLSLFLNFGILSFCHAQDNAAAIKLAVMAAPAELRDGAGVYSVSPKGELVVVRAAKNDLICLTDDATQSGLSVSCYHKDLEPFMARGRKLKIEGKNFQEIFDAREGEVKAGKLQMPKAPATLYVYNAKDGEFNAQSGEVTKGYLRYVIYIPFATAESTGLPLSPNAPGMPWIMDPGTHRAHIMINPPQN
jgi:hypothetical protein